MSDTNELILARDRQLDEFAGFLGADGADTLPSLKASRKAAIERFAEIGFPDRRNEEWKYTNIAPIARTAFARPTGETPYIDAAELAPYRFGDDSSPRLVFVDGRYAPSLSTNGAATKGVTLLPLAEAVRTQPKAVEPWLGQCLDYTNRPFVALNAALFEDGVFLHLDKGVRVEAPIELVFIATAGGDTPLASHPRIVIGAEAGAIATVTETHIGVGEGVSLTNVATEIIAREGAHVFHYRTTHLPEEAFHVSTLAVKQEGKTDVTSCTISIGGRITRNDYHAVMAGENGLCALRGLAKLRGREHVDNHLRVEHAAPACESREYFKSVLEDESRSAFTGRIFVHQIAQKTDGKQTNSNLLLSENAQADSRPQLEIFADDVKCTHAALTGQLDEDAIFYLRARGLSEREATSILVRAFAGEIIDTIKVDALRELVEERLFSRDSSIDAGAPGKSGALQEAV